MTRTKAEFCPMCGVDHYHEVPDAVPRLPHVESPDDLRWYATHEAMSRHKIFDILMALAEAMEGDSE